MSLKDDIQKIKSVDGIKSIDKKILIPAIIFIVSLFLLYYYYIFMEYPKAREAERQAAIEAKAKAAGLMPVQNDKTKDSKQTKSDKDKEKENEAAALNETYNINSSAASMDGKILKIPQNYIDFTKVAQKDYNLYINTFSVIYDYFEQVNAKNYGNVLNYMDKDFLSKNNITIDTLYNFYKNLYFANSSFFIDGILPDGSDYIVKLTIRNADVPGAAFFTQYRLKASKNSFKIVIENLHEYNVVQQ